MKKNIFIILLAIAATAIGGLTRVSKPKVIYGLDNRIEVSDIKNKKIQKISKSVAARFHKSSYSLFSNNKKEFVSFNYVTILEDAWGGNVCRGERFSKQPTLSTCTGFLIAPNKIATAGHCILEDNDFILNKMTNKCKGHSWYFGYELEKDQSLNIKNILKEELYNCKNVIVAKLSDDEDFAIIELDRNVKGVEPLKLRQKGRISTGSSLFVIGHPTGLPKKFSDSALVIFNTHDNYFGASLDTFAGSSGSPVINEETLEVEGVLVRGKTDYIRTSSGCNRINLCSSDGSSCLFDGQDEKSEEATRINKLIPFL